MFSYGQPHGSEESHEGKTELALLDSHFQDSSSSYTNYGNSCVVVWDISMETFPCTMEMMCIKIEAVGEKDTFHQQMAELTPQCTPYNYMQLNMGIFLYSTHLILKFPSKKSLSSCLTRLHALCSLYVCILMIWIICQKLKLLFVLCFS